MTLTNSEFTRQYLIWREEHTDDYSVEGFEAALQAVENKALIGAAKRILVDLLDNLDSRKEPETVMSLSRTINHCDTVVSSVVNMLEGNVEA